MNSRVLLQGPGESDIFFPDVAFDGEPVATVDDIVGAIERSDEFTTTIVGTRASSAATGPPRSTSPARSRGRSTPRTLQSTTVPDSGWTAPPEGTLWIMETPDGLAVITAEAFEPVAALADARALAEEILDSIVIGG